MTASTAPNSSYFNDLALAPDGSVYVVGYLYDSSTFNFGGKTVSGPRIGTNNALIVKINPSGTVDWVKSATSLSGSTGNYSFRSVAVDNLGYAYAAGYQTSNGIYNYSLSVSASGPNTASNAVLVKYAPDGTVVWAKTAQSGSASTSWNGVTVLGTQVIAVGEQDDSSVVNWGGVTTNSSSTSGAGLVVAFQTTNGAPLWGACLGGADLSSFEKAASSPDGQKVAIIGFTEGSTSYASTSFTVPGKSLIVLQLDSSGNLIWGRTAAATTTATSEGKSLSFTRKGSLWITGYYTKQNPGDAFQLGPLTLSVGPHPTQNTLFVAELGSNGSVEQLCSWSIAPNSSEGHGIAVDAWGNVFVAGNVKNSTYTFAGSISDVVLDYGSGNNTSNFFLLKLNPQGKAEWVRGHSLTTSPQATQFGKVSVSSAKVFVSGYTKGGIGYPLPAYPSGTINVQGNYWSGFNAALVVLQR